MNGPTRAARLSFATLLWWVPAVGTRHCASLVSEPAGSASLQPPPDFALSEPLPGGIQGWLRAVSDMRTCGPATRRIARSWSSNPEEQRKGASGNAAMGQEDQDRKQVQQHEGKMMKTKQNCSLERDDAADGEAELQRARTKNRAFRGAVQALRSC